MVETVVLTMEEYYERTVFLWFIIDDEPIFNGSWGIFEPFKHDRMLLLGEYWNEDRAEFVDWMHQASVYEVHKAIQDIRPDKYNPENRLHQFKRLTLIIEEVYEKTSLWKVSLSKPVKEQGKGK